MSSRYHIDDFMRGRIIGKIEEGRCCQEFIAHSVVSRLWKSFKTTGMCSRRHGGGRVRSTTPAEDRYIVLSAKKEQAHHSSAGGKSVSCCLRKADLPKNCCQTFEGRRTIRTQTCCVCPIDPDSTVLTVCNNVVSITIGLNRTGHAYYSQMRVGSVCHRIVDAN
ncbi:hypothetical protein TNCV_959681 [Trichonephila clavipes]|nr:hypothetical protein TNCV_959681 [Trichonephila clavipes]